MSGTARVTQTDKAAAEHVRAAIGAQHPIEALPPINTEAEEAVLGSLLMDPHAIYSIPFLTAQDFYRDRNAAIFSAVRRVADRSIPPDFVTISDDLRANGVYEEVGGLAYLSHLIGVVPTAVHVEHYAKLVKNAAVRRRGISASGKIAALLYDQSLDLAEGTVKAFELLSNALHDEASAGVYGPADLVNLFIDQVLKISEAKKEALGLMTGTRLDRFLNGLKPGCVYLLAARPGMGKSTVLQGLIRKWTKEGKKAFLATAEMTALQIVWREASNILGIDGNELERRIAGEDPYADDPERNVGALVNKVVQELGSRGLHIFDASGMTSMEIRSRAARMKATVGLDVVAIDYVQRLGDAGGDEEGENENRALTKVSNNICDMAKALHVPVVVVSQLSRSCEYRQDKRPIPSDLRGSGSLEQDAHAILFIYRDEVYNKDTEDKGIAEIIISKNRNAPAGKICRFVWRPEVMEYADYEPETPDQPPAIETYGEFHNRKKGQRQQ
ncbi:MAG: replicative DNA helicase [Sphingomonadaceae bacterium]